MSTLADALDRYQMGRDPEKDATEARTCPDTRNAPKGPQTGAQAAKRADWLDRLATTAPCTTSAALLRAWADDLRAIAPRMKESL